MFSSQYNQMRSSDRACLVSCEKPIGKLTFLTTVKSDDVCFARRNLEPTRVRWNGDRVLKDVRNETSMRLLAGSIRQGYGVEIPTLGRWPPSFTPAKHDSRTSMPQWRWAHVAVPLPTFKLARCQHSSLCIS